MNFLCFKKIVFTVFGCWLLLSISSCTVIPITKTHIVTSSPPKVVKVDNERAVEKEKTNIDRIKLFDWNVAREDKDKLKETIAGFINKSADSSAIIMTFQEALLKEDELKTNIYTGGKLDWCFAPNIFIGSKNSYSGVLTASNLKLKSADAFISNGIESAIAPTRKTILFSKYDLGKDKLILLVANVHALNFPPGTSGFREQIIKLKATLQKHKGPIIVVGDFNTWSEYKLKFFFAAMARKPLVLTQVKYKNGDERTRFSCLIYKQPLEHIFYTADYLSQEGNAEVLTGIDASDHNPLCVEFKLKSGLE